MVSIVMPLYNAEQFLDAAIKSVLDQTYSNWELIIVDDGSIDNSLKIAQKYASEKVRVFSQANKGACSARNKGLIESKGEYIKFLDADDVLDPNCLELQTQQIEQLEDKQIPFGDYNFIDANNNVLSEYSFNLFDGFVINRPYFFYQHWEVLISCPMHRKERLKVLGGFDESLAKGQEFDLHFRLALSDIEFVYFPIKTFSYRSYQSVSRISTEKKVGNPYIDQKYLEIRHLKFERLLKEKYGIVPEEYKADFFNFWFSRTRQCFATSHKEEGLKALSKANEYIQPNTFFKWYTKFGRLIGFVHLEGIFQLRLKLLKKQKFQHIVE